MVMRETVLLRASNGSPVRWVEAALMAIRSLTRIDITSSEGARIASFDNKRLEKSAA